MPINDRTTARNYAKPNPANLLSEDVDRLREALDSIDADVAALVVSLLTKAATASPGFTGTPTAPTPETDTNTTQLATTAFVKAQTSTANPAGPGTAAAGVSSRCARADHVHPRDDTKAPLASPEFTGTPTAPTPTTDTNTTQLATTQFVVGQGYVKQTRQVFTGAGLTGGGDLTENRTIAPDIATQAQAEAGTATDKLMTPQRTAQAITGRAATQAEAEAGTNTTQLMTPQRTAQAIAAQAQRVAVYGASKAATGGTVEFTDVPSWAKSIKLIFSGVSDTANSTVRLQFGTAGAYKTSGYTSAGSASQPAILIDIASSNNVPSAGILEILNPTGNLWVVAGAVQSTGAATNGGVTLDAALTRLRVTHSDSNTFDAGNFYILYEG